MKTFREFLSENAVKAQQAWQDWMKANPQEFSKGGRFYERGSSAKTTAAAKEFMKGYMKTGKPPAGFEVKSTKVSGQDIRSGSQKRTQQPSTRSQTPPSPKGTQAPPKQAKATQAPPKQPKATQAPPKATQAPPKQPKASTPPPRNTQASSVPPKSPSGGLATPSKPSSIPTSKGPGLRSRLGKLAGPATTVASGALEYKARRDEGQSKARAAGGALASGAGYAKGASLGFRMTPGPLPVKLAGATVGGLVGDTAASAAYDYAANKTRPARQAASKATGFDKFQQKQALIKPGSGLSGVARAQQTVDTRAARQVAAKTGAYGTRQGSALTGTGGPTTVNKKAGTITSGGKTAKLASTQLVRDPKSGKQVVGDLAYKGGKAVYLARPSVASRDTSLAARLGRALNVGKYSKAAETKAAKQEYRTALKNTQTYQKQLGITPKSATSQKLPGRGVGPAKVGPKLVGPKIVGPKKVGTGAKPSATVKPV